ncbi:hypothetical protein QBC36DRAFT_316171 [Triangularia setosa]|uniref:Uncharacterized protein n=1 Tax=Triangularia setosa TaxID=2587417 RepID=A0AAN6VWK3_9PEZI|nr:hypothetical protein QBC36DRAFT_316171 [Podospora setosa]
MAEAVTATQGTAPAEPTALERCMRGPGYRDTTQDLLEKFEDENWGLDDEGYVSDGGDDVGPSAQSLILPQQVLQETSTVGVRNIRPPPPGHPIYGRDGIMHGIICYRSPKKGLIYKLNPSCSHEKINAALIGEGNLKPSDWWPLQTVAVFHRAHGESQGGIFGSVSMVALRSAMKLTRMMAMSCITLDNNGVTITSVGTQALDKSRETRQPVRVLRGGASRIWAAVCGIQYDGLYEFTGKKWVQTSNDERPRQQDLREIRLSYSLGSIPSGTGRLYCQDVAQRATNRSRGSEMQNLSSRIGLCSARAKLHQWINDGHGATAVTRHAYSSNGREVANALSGL